MSSLVTFSQKIRISLPPATEAEHSVMRQMVKSLRASGKRQWTMFWQYYISIFLATNDHCTIDIGAKRKKGFFALAQKCLKKILNCRLIVPSYEKNTIWD
jgi:hypothetical protein